MEENLKRIYHAAMMDLHTAVEPDLDQIWTPDAGLRIAHGCQIGAPARTQSVLGFPPPGPARGLLPWAVVPPDHPGLLGGGPRRTPCRRGRFP